MADLWRYCFYGNTISETERAERICPVSRRQTSPGEASLLQDPSLSVLSLAQDCSLSDDLARESLVTRQNSPRQNGLVKIAPTKQLARLQHSQGKNIPVITQLMLSVLEKQIIFSP